jgi:hypothetical protein
MKTTAGISKSFFRILHKIHGATPIPKLRERHKKPLPLPPKLVL